MNDIREVADFLKKSDKIEIFTHIHPDGDALGSSWALASALKKIGKEVRVTVNDTLPRDFEYIHSRAFDNFIPETTITVDVASPALLGDFPEDKVIDLAIDHHLKNSLNTKELYCNPNRAACGEIIFEIISELGVEPDRYIAECLYTAIATDTGCFKFSNTNSNTFSVVSALCRYTENGNFGYLNTPLFITKTQSRIAFEAHILSNLQYFFDGKVALVAVTSSLLDSLGIPDCETSGVEQLSKIPEGVVLGITLKERDGGFKVSMRSSDSLDCSKICAEFGGGGHHSASGCFIEGSIDEVTRILISYLEENNVI